ncbi:site-specific integrase [Bradyrhizobium sp. NBAIM01]|uniref:tyrosine-type recombinase/integrase n=1 Tax=Bradyrhizobium sp. NBAIM01 TaxID=2793818 RepID=UPI001CD1959C|nr:site-specific integrase [Bradyrhizobium sp. NBAIM01]
MPKRSLTDRFCAHAKAAEGDVQTDYFDEDYPGLALRVSQSGAKSWTYLFTWSGKRVRMTFGTYPATSLASAHTRADEARADLEAGKDPRAAKAGNLDVVLDAFVKRHVTKLRSADQITRAFDAYVRPRLGAKSIYDLKRRDVVEMLDAVEDEAGPVMADRVLAHVRKAFNWQAARDDEFKSPIVRGMARTKPKERSRKRILADDEIRDVWGALDTAPDLPACYPAYVRSLLLCATRRNESAGMHSTELDGDLWTIPGERYKNKLDHVIPLSRQARALIGGKPDGFEGNSWFVFSSATGGNIAGKKPFSGFAKAKRALDAEIAKIRKAEGRDPIPRWTLHDLRRTARSLMSRAKVPADHAERCLGHVIGGVRETYDRYEYLDEKRAAFVALAGLVDRIVSGRPTALRLVRVARPDATGSEAEALSQ